MKNGKVRRWWRDAGSAAQLGAVVAVIVAVCGAAMIVIQPMFADEKATSAPSASDGVPNLAYTVSLPPVRTQCLSSWIVPGPVADGTKFPPRQVPAGGVLAAGSSMEVIVQETTGKHVIVHSLWAKVISRDRPFAGVLLPGTSCGGTLPLSLLEVDLGDEVPVSRSRGGGKVDKTAATQPPFPWSVAENDPVGYSIELKAVRARVEFVLVLEWSWGGVRHELTIDNAGKPFVVSSAEGLTGVMCPAVGDAWIAGRLDTACA